MKQKDLWMFGTESEVNRSNSMIGAGIGMIIVGVTTVILGERHFYKTSKAFRCDDPKSTVINDIFEDIISHRMVKGA